MPEFRTFALAFRRLMRLSRVPGRVAFEGAIGALVAECLRQGARRPARSRSACARLVGKDAAPLRRNRGKWGQTQIPFLRAGACGTLLQQAYGTGVAAGKGCAAGPCDSRFSLASSGEALIRARGSHFVALAVARGTLWRGWCAAVGSSRGALVCVAWLDW